VNAPRVNRIKTIDLTSIGMQRYHFRGRLTDTSFHGNYGADPPQADATIHDFVVDGELCGEDLTVARLDVSAETHPYSQCPAMLPSCQALVGQSVGRGWRATVLNALGATAGCTHVTTLLLGLAEARTMAIFLQMNADTAYSPQSRGDGRWTATGLDVAPGIVGACHALQSSGPVIRQARAVAGGDTDPLSTST
jgi:hypothetical protein